MPRLKMARHGHGVSFLLSDLTHGERCLRQGNINFGVKFDTGSCTSFHHWNQKMLETEIMWVGRELRIFFALSKNVKMFRLLRIITFTRAR